ncbi:hypothetical protein SAMN05216490_4984 [Mucilaginibacter mallensis]|uniref:GLPGLI family protein n=1 Tax=Mucilaginibacter mallensis TaxID=652787 RepID=A0A1H2CF35_MUCMA|nr:hypothetical protein [Mucilaginibacter mallensis]SDT69110.1 hypothetical protein SAMN05216490_4984 [Mucilaginibacter mallensis]
MKKILFSIFVICLSFNAMAQFILPTDLGEGFISIKISWLPFSDTVKLSTEYQDFMTFDYHVYHNKVFRQGSQKFISTDSTKRQMELPNKTKMESTLTASVVIPTYLLDWENKTVYTYFTQQNKLYLSEDSLKYNSDEMFYKSLFLFKSKKHLLIDTINQKVIILCGIQCYVARYKHSDKGNWLRFVYTAKKQSLYSPINGFFDADFKYQVMSIDVENQANVKDTLKITAIFRMEVTSINNDRQNLDLFKLPHNTPILKQVPNSEMYKNP